LALNKDNVEAVIKHSKWSFRHYLIAVAGSLMILNLFAEEANFISNKSVVSGDRVSKYARSFMLEHNVLTENDEIKYFYSNAPIIITNDGNGISDRHVFSYWRAKDNTVYTEQALFSEIKDITVDKAEALLENTTISISRKDESEFELFLPNDSLKNQEFIDFIKSKIKPEE